MPPVSERGPLQGGGPGRLGAASARRGRGERPRTAVFAVVLLCGAWGATAVLVISVLASVHARAWPLRALDALVPGPAGPREAAPGFAAGMALCALLFVAGALLLYAVPELLQGNRRARVMIRAGVPLLVAEPVRRAVLTLGEDGTDVTVGVCALGIAAAALLAVLLPVRPPARLIMERDLGELR